MQCALGPVDDEVVDQLAVAVEGLSADAGGAREDVAYAELRDEAAKLGDE